MRIPARGVKHGITDRLTTGFCLFITFTICLGMSFPWLMLPKWKTLGNPPKPATKFLDASLGSVIVQTSNGDLFIYDPEYTFWWDDFGTPVGEWKGTNSSTIEWDENDCNYSAYLAPPPPGVVIDRINDTFCFEFSKEARYVLLEDGSVWWWSNRDDRLQFLLMCPYGIGGFLIGLMAISIWSRFKKR